LQRPRYHRGRWHPIIQSPYMTIKDRRTTTRLMRAVSFFASVRDGNLTLVKNRFSRRGAGAQRIVIDRNDYRRVVSDPDARGDVAPSDSSKPIWGVLGTGWTSYRARKNLAGGGGKHRSAVPRQSGRSADSLAANHTKLIGLHHVVDGHRVTHVSRSRAAARHYGESAGLDVSADSVDSAGPFGFGRPWM